MPKNSLVYGRRRLAQLKCGFGHFVAVIVNKALTYWPIDQFGDRAAPDHIFAGGRQGASDCREIAREFARRCVQAAAAPASFVSERRLHSGPPIRCRGIPACRSTKRPSRT